MNFRLGLIAVAFVGFVTGCATTSLPTESIPLAEGALAAKSGRIGVAETPLPQVDTHLPGAGCLLCYAAASAANSQLTTHARTLPYEDLPKLKNEVADVLSKQGLDVVVIDDELKLDTLPSFNAPDSKFSDRDFSSLQQKYKIEKLLVINVTRLGMLRTYSAYVPTSDPKAVFEGAGYLVNLKNNAYEWYLPVNIAKSSDGPWDEPPKFPGLTNAYFQALELGKDSFLKPFAKKVNAVTSR